MDEIKIKNIEGYVDMTAFTAMTNVIRESEKNMETYRGDIFTYKTATDVDRVALVLTPNSKSTKFVSILALQDEPKGYINVPIVMTSGVMYADCGLVSFTKRENLIAFCKTASDDELHDVTVGVSKCLGIPMQTQCIDVTTPESEHTSCDETLIAAQTEVKIYKDLYESLLAKMVR